MTTHYEIRRPDGTVGKYPRVTTVLNVLAKGEELERWKEDVGNSEARRQLRAAQEAGTAFHKYMEARVLGERPTPPEGMEHMAEQFELALRILRPATVAAERVVASHVHEYAGTADAVAKVQGRYVLLDWKTSSMLPWTYALQTTAYTEAWNETIADGEMPTLEYQSIIVRIDKFTPEQHAEREEARRARAVARLEAMMREDIVAAPEEIDRARRSVERFRPRKHIPLEIVYAPCMREEWLATLRLYRARGADIFTRMDIASKTAEALQEAF